MKLKSTLKQYTMVIALVIVFIFFTVLTGGRLILAQNISNLLLQNAYVMVMACGMLLCILTGGNVDLSVGATLCLSAALAATALQSGKSPVVAIIMAMAAALVIGLFQGILIGYILFLRLSVHWQVCSYTEVWHVRYWIPKHVVLQMKNSWIFSLHT